MEAVELGPPRRHRRRSGTRQQRDVSGLCGAGSSGAELNDDKRFVSGRHVVKLATGCASE